MKISKITILTKNSIISVTSYAVLFIYFLMKIVHEYTHKKISTSKKIISTQKVDKKYLKPNY